MLEQAIIKGAGSRDFFGTAYGQNGGVFEGFKIGDVNVQLDDTLLLIEIEAAKATKQPLVKPVPVPVPGPGAGDGGTSKPTQGGSTGTGTGTPGAGGITPTPSTPKPHAFYGSIEVNPVTAKVRLVQLADEIISVLAADPNATLKITVEIQAEFPDGASDQIKRAVSENAGSLGFKSKIWE